MFGATLSHQARDADTPAADARDTRPSDDADWTMETRSNVPDSLRRYTNHDIKARMDLRPKSRIPPSPATRWIWSLISLIPPSASASDTDATSPVSIGIGAGVVALVLLAAAEGRHVARLRRALADQVAHERAARSRLEERLHRSERLVEETQRLGHLGTWEWDAENDRLEWSAEIYRIFAMPAERFPGTYQGFLTPCTRTTAHGSSARSGKPSPERRITTASIESWRQTARFVMSRSAHGSRASRAVPSE